MIARIRTTRPEKTEHKISAVRTVRNFCVTLTFPVKYRKPMVETTIIVRITARRMDERYSFPNVIAAHVMT